MRTLRVSGCRALEELRRCGAVQAIGIGVNEREVLLKALEWVPGTPSSSLGAILYSSRRAR
jgi:hypothetical protein